MKSSAPPRTHRATLEPPVRLLAGGGSALERQLVESASVDRVPSASLEHLARALNVSGPPAAPKALAELSQGAQVLRYGSFVGGGALSLVAALAALHAFTPSHAEQTAAATAPDAPMSVDAPAVVAVTELRAPDSAPLPATSAPPPPVAAPRAAAKAKVDVHGGAVRKQRQEASAERARPTDASGLRAELRALEAAQSALRKGQTQDAARALADYSRRFPQGELALEAELLHVDVLLARGEREPARARAQALLAQPGAARYRSRLEALSPNTARDSLAAPRSGSERAASPH